MRSTASWHLLECQITSFCQVYPLNYSCRKVWRFQIIWSAHLLLREGGKVPDHLRHLSNVSPQLQVLAIGFSWALYFCQKMVERCVRLAGFSADALLVWIVTGHLRCLGIQFASGSVLTGSVRWAATARRF